MKPTLLLLQGRSDRENDVDERLCWLQLTDISQSTIEMERNDEKKHFCYIDDCRLAFYDGKQQLCRLFASRMGS